MTDDILIRLGINTTAVHAGLKSVTTHVTGWADGPKPSVSSAFKGLLLPLTGAGIVAAFEGVVDTVRKLKIEADALEMPVEFMQDIRNIGRHSKVSAEDVDKLVMKFAKALPAGADLEQEFYKLADRLDGLHDPGEKARAAFDVVGKSFADLLRIVKGGSGEMKELASHFNKFTESEIEAIEQFHTSGIKMQGFTGRMILSISEFLGKTVPRYVKRGNVGMDVIWKELASEENADFAQRMAERAIARQNASVAAAKKAFADYKQQLEDIRLKSGTTAEKMEILNRRFNEQLELADKSRGNTVDFYSHMITAETLLAEMNRLRDEDRKKQEEADKKHLDAIRAEREASRHIAEANKALNDEKADRSKVGLDELISSAQEKMARFREFRKHQAGLISGGAGLTDAEATALNIKDLEERATQSRLFGNSKGADELTDRALQLRKSLVGALREGDADPLRSLERAHRRAVQHLKELVDKANSGGIPVQGAD